MGGPQERIDDVQALPGGERRDVASGVIWRSSGLSMEKRPVRGFAGAWDAHGELVARRANLRE